MRRGRTLGEAASDVRAALAEFIEQLRRAGHSVGESVRLGALLRLRPKLMTASIAMAAWSRWPLADKKAARSFSLWPASCLAASTPARDPEPTAAKLTHDMPSTRRGLEARNGLDAR